jgi:hypothetical protein
MLRLARNVSAFEDLGLDVMHFEAVFVVRAIAERLVAGTSAPTVRLHYFPSTTTRLGPVFRGTDNNFWNKTLVW